MVPVGGTPDQLRALVAADLASWSAVVRAAKIEPI
jgi:tripartite-type tricarboxylate transporter receptor subunit TctC